MKSKTTIKNLIRNLVLGLTFLLLSILPTHAGFGVSPSDISYENLKPGASFVKEFTMSRSDSLEEMDIFIEPDLKEMDSWFTYNPGKTFKFAEGSSLMTFQIVVNIPEDAKYQNYSGAIRVKAVPSNQEVRGVSITQGVRLDAGLIVTETDIRKLLIKSIKILDAVINEPMKIEIIGENQGNVDASPTVKVRIMDLQMNPLEEHEIANFGFVKPNETSTLIAEFTSKLPEGEYFVEVTVYLDGVELRKERLVVRIVPSASVEKPDETVVPSFLAGIRDFFRENRGLVVTISFAILIALVIEILTYVFTEKLWNKQKLKQHRDKLWAILLGSKNYTRAVLSFAAGFIVFLMLILYPLLTIENKEITEIEDIDTGETQGAQDATVPDSGLNVVFPPILTPEYSIYQEPDTGSKAIYIAQEDEQFNVLEETEDWYKILLNDGRTGWLPKATAKSKLTEEQ